MVTNRPAARRLAAQQRVLIVDRSEDNREVLKTVLKRQGVEIFEAAHGSEGLDMARDCHPDVLVLDVETAEQTSDHMFESFARQASFENTAMVLLGKVNGIGDTRQSPDVVAKPYHYRPLVRKIEELLSQAETHGSRGS